MIRMITLDDDLEYLRLLQTLDGETENMLLCPGERTSNKRDVRTHIKGVLGADNKSIFVSTHGNDLVGYLSLFGGRWRRNWHVATLSIGVLKACWGQGIGTALWAAAYEWAAASGIKRIELTVLKTNERAFGVYKVWGFEVEGVRSASMKFDGLGYVGEYYMALWLPDTGEAS